MYERFSPLPKITAKHRKWLLLPVITTIFAYYGGLRKAITQFMNGPKLRRAYVEQIDDMF